MADVCSSGAANDVAGKGAGVRAVLEQDLAVHDDRAVADGVHHVALGVGGEERWATQELLEAHMKSPTMAGMAALAPHFAGPPSLAKYEVS